jgi:hypothetical protein
MYWQIWLGYVLLISALGAAESDPLLSEPWLVEGLSESVVTDQAPPAWNFRLDHVLSGNDHGGLTHHRSTLNATFETVLAEQWFVRFQALDTLFWSPDSRLTNHANYTNEFSVHDMWAQYSVDYLSFKLGKQSVVWGAVEGAEVVDVITPLDRRDFLLADSNGVRQAQWMAVMSAYKYASSWQAFITVEPTFDIYPETIKESQTDLWEWGVRGQFEMGDAAEWALQFAHLVPNTPFDLALIPYNLLAISAVMTRNSWLWKADVGVRMGETNTLHGALGVESHWQQQTMTAFVSYHDTIPAVAWMGIQWRKSYWYDTVLGSVMLTGTADLDSTAWVSQVTYRANDRVEVLAAWMVVLLAEDQSMMGYSQGDQQLMLKLLYQF